MKRKIAILTLVSYNHGNRLQNYALQTFLEKIGFEVETILRQKYTPIQKIKRIVRNYLIKDKYTKFNKFNMVIKWSKEMVAPSSITVSNNTKYDYYIVGSDQIWNPRIDTRIESVYLPDIVPEKKIAYAASFGITDFREDEISTIVPLLRGFKSISVREESGKEFINKYIPDKSVVVVDPVMLLERDDWEMVERRPSFIDNDGYLLTYFLGDEHYNSVVEYISKKLGVKIFDINPSETVIDPFEFIYLINHARFVLTDSFHGAVFSFIFRKKFRIMDRRDNKDDMSCRIDSLCKMFQLHNLRGFRLSDNLEDSCVFTSSYELLEEKRRSSIKYLKEVLDNE